MWNIINFTRRREGIYFVLLYANVVLKLLLLLLMMNTRMINEPSGCFGSALNLYGGDDDDDEHIWKYEEKQKNVLFSCGLFLFVKRQSSSQKKAAHYVHE